MVRRSVVVLCPIYLLLIAADQLLFCVAGGRRVERRRHIVNNNGIRPPVVENGIESKVDLDFANSPSAPKADNIVEDKHCWIRVAERGEKAVDVHGTCVELVKGTFACQNKQFLDPHNIFCKFLDR